MKREGSTKTLATTGAWVLGICGGLAALLFLPGLGTARPDARFVYQQVDDISLAAEVFRPREWAAVDRRPCVVWFFGGGFESGAPVQFHAASRRLARLGLVAICADYRVRMRHGADLTPLDAVKDARAALRWVRAHAGELGIDPDRIAAGGGSSGGHLALACAVLDGPDEPGADTAIDPAPAALLLFNPVADFDISFVREKASGAAFEALLSISPYHRIDAPLPPTLIMHGTADRIVPLESVTRFAEKARALGSQQVEVTTLPGRGHEFHLHGFDGNRGYEAAMERVEEFLQGLGWIAPGT